MKNRKTTYLPTPLALACALLLCPALAAAQAANTLPTGGQVTAGTASLQQAGNSLTIRQTSDRAIIDWRSFSIGGQAGVTFEQPSSSSVVLNRVLGSDPSRIAGSLRANGQVFLVNPNGVIFGQGARVDTQGLVASTLSLADDDFLAGRYRFTRSGSTAAVVNQGELHARYVALLAPEVRNEGAIVAERGTIALAGGEAVTLKLTGQDLVDIVVDPASIATLVENRRLVQAADGKVLIAANSANSLLGAVINTGRIEANGIAADGGLVRINASGRIDLGGSVSADAGAEAGSHGKGGRIEAIADLARADSQAFVSGTLSARGGAAGGDGGFIETSGSHLNIASEARVDTSAARGSFGQWLLDPTDFRIAASGGDMTGSALSTALQTSSVTIETRATGSGLGDIRVDDAISWSNNPGTTLTLKAHRNIEINARITVGSVGYATTTTPGSTYDMGCHCYPDVVTPAATGERLHLLAGQSGRGGFRLGSAGAVDTFYSGSGGYGKVLLGATAAEVTVAAPLRAGYRSAGHILTAYVQPTNTEASSVYGDAPTLQYAMFDAASGGTALNLAAGGTAGWSTTLNGKTNAGTYSLSYTGGLSLAEYDILAGSAVNWTVKPRPLNLSATKIYDGVPYFVRAGLVDGASYTLSGMVNGDAMPAPDGGYFTGSSANAGSYAALAAGGAPALLNPNYTLAGGSTLLTIQPRATSFTVSKTYDGTAVFNTGFVLSNPAPYAEAPTISGKLEGRTANVSTTQGFFLEPLQLDDPHGNYQVSSFIVASITPKPLAVTVSKTYDGSTSFSSGFMLSGMAGSETAPTLTGTTSSASANAGSYTGLAGSALTLSDTNYIVGTVAALISPKALSISATRNYDGTTILLPAAFKLEGMVASQTAPKVSGSASITAAGVASTAYTFGTSALSLDNANYTLPVAGLATITPKPLNIVVSKAYDGNASFVTGTSAAPSASSFTVSGMVGVEVAPTVTGSASVSSANASSTAFSAFQTGSTLALSNAANYTLAGGTVKASITPRPLTVTVIKNYDGNANFTSGFKLTGMVGTEAAPSITEGSASVSSIAGSATAYTSFTSNTLKLANANYTAQGGLVSATIVKPARVDEVASVFAYTVSNYATLYSKIKNAYSPSAAGGFGSLPEGDIITYFTFNPLLAYSAYKNESMQASVSTSTLDSYRIGLNTARASYCPATLCAPFDNDDIKAWLAAKLLGS